MPCLFYSDVMNASESASMNKIHAPFAEKMKQRDGLHKATVAVDHKMERIAWAGNKMAQYPFIYFKFIYLLNLRVLNPLLLLYIAFSFKR